MLRKFVLPLVAVMLLGNPAFAASPDAITPAKTAQATPAPSATALQLVAAPMKAKTAVHTCKRVHHVRRHVRHHRHLATAKVRAHAAKRG